MRNKTSVPFMYNQVLRKFILFQQFHADIDRTVVVFTLYHSYLHVITAEFLLLSCCHIYRHIFVFMFVSVCVHAHTCTHALEHPCMCSCTFRKVGVSNGSGHHIFTNAFSSLCSLFCKPFFLPVEPFVLVISVQGALPNSPLFYHFNILNFIIKKSLQTQ